MRRSMKWTAWLGCLIDGVDGVTGGAGMSCTTQRSSPMRLNNVDLDVRDADDGEELKILSGNGLGLVFDLGEALQGGRRGRRACSRCDARGAAHLQGLPRPSGSRPRSRRRGCVSVHLVGDEQDRVAVVAQQVATVSLVMPTVTSTTKRTMSASRMGLLALVETLASRGIDAEVLSAASTRQSPCHSAALRSR